MSTIARIIAATPKRTADEAWQIIVDLISDQSSEAAKTLRSITGVASAIIVDEVPSNVPIIVIGKGPRLRIYCVYGEDALLDDNCNEESLVQKPTTEDWHIYLPCVQDELDWVTQSLELVSDFVTAYDKDKEPDTEKGADPVEPLTLDKNSFLNKL